MAHVGIERLGAGQRQHDRADDNEQVPALRLQEHERVQRVERMQDRRLPARSATRRWQRESANQSTITGPNIDADALRAEALNDEQADQHADRDRQHPGLQRRGHDLEPLGRAEHRDRRCDDAVTVEEGGAEYAGQEERRAARGVRPAERTASAVSAMMPPSPLLSARRISSTYFSVTTNISAQKIVDTAPTMCGASSGKPTRRAEDLLHRVQRTRADVAVDDADGAERERRQALAAGGFVHAEGTGGEGRRLKAPSR